MPEEKDWTKYLVAGAIVGGVGLAGYGIYRFSEWLGAREEHKWELITEYQTELQEMIAFQSGLIEKGEITDLERELLATMINAMDQKQLVIESYSTHWLVDLVISMGEVLKSIGLYVLLPIIGSVAAFAAWRIFKHWPLSKRQPPPPPTTPPPPPVPAVPPPPFVCPKCLLEFFTADALLDHINTHPVNTNPNDIRQAQAYLNATSAYTRTLVSMESGLYQQMYVDWTVIGAASLILIVVAIGIVLSMGTATPGVITGAYAVVAEAEAVAARAAAALVLV